MALGGFFKKLKSGLSKTRTKLSTGLGRILTIGRKLDEETLEELEELLISADIGPRTVDHIIDGLRESYRDRTIEKPELVYDFLRNHLKEEMPQERSSLNVAPSPPTVIMVVGVNGCGKTTSIAKIAKRFVGEGRSVLLAASDTFRAAAVEQLDIWAKRIGVDIVKQARGADPAAVAWSAVDAAVARGTEVLIVDTAGRLHTERNLMVELEKIHRVLDKKLPGAPHEVLLVLDATTGQNAIAQAKVFSESVPVSGIVLAKLDGTAKGGIVLTIRKQIDIPVKFVGVGEREDDLEPFDPDRFIDALLTPPGDETVMG